MILVHKKWEEFCRQLHYKDIHSVCARNINKNSNKYLVLKHDVETDVLKAYRMAKIEHKYNHCGSYYVQAYLLDNKKNINMLKEMQTMGHEISYHYDVMDSCRGNIDEAIVEFERNKEKFKLNGFDIQTLCQHGNPIIERVGYNSNRDFFRNNKVQSLYPHLCDIMVDFSIKKMTNYQYYSDAGRKFKYIFDPFYNDVKNSDNKNIEYKDLDALLEVIIENNNSIISVHPHRWTNSIITYSIRTMIFRLLKIIAMVLVKIPMLKKIFNKYYFLAKKI